MHLSRTSFAHTFDWNLLKTFEEIVAAGGITRAAQEWERKQPTVSLALQRLEGSVGARLCQRGPGGFRLTDEGELVAELCRSVVRLVESLPDQVATAADEIRGRVRVRIVSNLVDPVLDAALAAFHARHPAVEIDVEVGTWETVTDAVREQVIDVGVAPARLGDPALRYDWLCREVHHLYCGRPHPLYGCAAPAPARIADQAFILTGADEPDALTHHRERFGLGQRVAGISRHLEEARRLAVLGVGLCYLPEAYVAPDVEQGRLWRVALTPVEPPIDIFVITNREASRSAAARYLLGQIRLLLPRVPDAH